MKKAHVITLPHLTNDIVVDAKKTKLCSFAVALEGWRRGLTLKWYTADYDKYKEMIVFGVNPPGRLFSLSNGERTHYFFRTRGDKVTNEAVEIGSDKEETKKWLRKANVPTPEGTEFTAEDSEEDIIEYALKLEFPLVLKPTDGSLGKGVVTNINSVDELRKAIHYVRDELEFENLILERFIPGKEYRIYVVEDKAIAVYNRQPANITGDGVHTVEELIYLKNYERRQNARLNSCLIEIDKEVLHYVQQAGYTLDSVPKKGEKIFLRQKTNVSAGGDPIDVTDDFPDEVKQIAIDAVKAIPGLHHCGVDIIVDMDKRPLEKAAVVIELNPTAQIGGPLFPLAGKARDIPKAIIDYYFPETKGINTETCNFYFDLNTVLEPLTNRSAIEVEVAPAPKNNLYVKRYIVSGSVKRISYHEWIRIEALNRGLHGFINVLPDKEIEVVIAGEDKETVNSFREVFYQNTRLAEVKKVKARAWTEPVKIGFEINEGFNPSSYRSVEAALKRLDKEFARLEKQKRYYNKEATKIVNSRTWRVIRPLRKVEGFFRNLVSES